MIIPSFKKVEVTIKPFCDTSILACGLEALYQSVDRSRPTVDGQVIPSSQRSKRGA